MLHLILTLLLLVANPPEIHETPDRVIHVTLTKFLAECLEVVEVRFDTNLRHPVNQRIGRYFEIVNFSQTLRINPATRLHPDG